MPRIQSETLSVAVANYVRRNPMRSCECNSERKMLSAELKIVSTVKIFLGGRTRERERESENERKKIISKEREGYKRKEMGMNRKRERRNARTLVQSGGFLRRDSRDPSILQRARTKLHAGVAVRVLIASRQYRVVGICVFGREYGSDGTFLRW